MAPEQVPVLLRLRADLHRVPSTDLSSAQRVREQNRSGSPQKEGDRSGSPALSPPNREPPAHSPERPNLRLHAPFRHPSHGTKKRRPSTGGALLSFAPGRGVGGVRAAGFWTGTELVVVYGPLPNPAAPSRLVIVRAGREEYQKGAKITK
jgi:hypothetical protein